MTAQYRLELRDADGTLFAGVTDFISVSCVARVNAPGLLVSVLEADHAAISSLQKRSQVDFWMRDREFDIDWMRFFGGLLLAETKEYPEDGLNTYRLSAPGDLWLLGTRVVNWYTGYANRSEFSAQPAETIMKTVVNYNCGASATVVNGRKRGGTIGGLSVEADGGRGTSVDWYCHGDNVLKTLQELASVGGGDFDLVKSVGTGNREFRFYPGQLGTDRSASVLFSIEYGNMVDVKYAVNWMEERTVAAVWGQNSGAARAYETVLGPDYAASNDIELYVDARDIATDLTDRGTKAMEENLAQGLLSFKVAQTPGCMFGRHYFLGDLVTVRNPRSLVDEIYQVAAVGLHVSGTDRTTGVELRQTGKIRGPDGVTEQMVDRMTRLERAVSRLERLE